MFKVDVVVLRAMLSFQLQLEGCHHKVMIAANVCSKGCPYFRFADAGLEALQNQNEVGLIVDLTGEFQVVVCDSLCD